MITVAGLLVVPLSVGAIGNDISFNRDVLPILSNNCFLCHGPDKGTRKAGMRLDIPQGALADGLILPTDDQPSTLLVRIMDSNDKHRMPPAETLKKLTQSQIDTLHRWVEAGAPYEPHWAFVAPSPVSPPEADDWARNTVDAFIKARLDAEHLEPNPQAHRRTLIRRVTLDLTGLPPTLAAIDAFLNDDRIDAYERLVDTLLASKHFGEHQARPWLDLSRYADSQGFEKDNLRTMWRYRDWVINAFNEDMPFDQFTLEQMAGDLLPNATLEQRIATGFHRNTQTNTEGGTDNEEFRSGAVIDRVNTTMQGWMALTAGCAQCHDHKFDPLSQQDYFELYAFLNQTADADLDNDAPFINAPTLAQQHAIKQSDTALDAFQLRLAHPDTELQQLLQHWVSTWCTTDDWSTLQPLAAGAIGGTTYDVFDDGLLVATGPAPDTETTTVHLRTNLPALSAVRLDVPDQGPGSGPGRAANRNFVVSDITISTSDLAKPKQFKLADASFNQLDFNAQAAIDGDTGSESGWAIAGGIGSDQHAVFTLAEPLAVPSDGQITITLVQSHGTLHTLGRFKLSGTNHLTPTIDLNQDILEAAMTPADARVETHWSILAEAALDKTPLLPALHAERKAIQDARQRAMQDIPTALILEALPDDQQRTTKLFLGGSFLSPDHDRGALEPSVPEALHAPLDQTISRIDLAHWLVAQNNPLTARVQVNRAWARLFGHGLVSTVDNFGVQGARPSHPNLLDWLALHYQDDLSWSNKALLRLLVTSATYRQSAESSPAVLNKDPENRLLSRASRIRLSAEQLRDAALETAGLLKKDRIGGPSVVPRLPEGMLPQAFTTFVQEASTGDDLYRRGLYTQWRRTGHYPTFATFDAPSRELCTVARERSNTPLQALIMLNDDVFVEAAQGLARRSIQHTDPIGVAFELALARSPTAHERGILQAIYDAALAHTDTQRTLALAIDPLGPLPDGMDPHTAMAMTVTCNVLLNLDEFVNRP